MTARVRAAAEAARAAGALSRLTGRGGGTTLPGHVLLRLAPDALPELAAGLADGVALISATNGKTTSAAMLATILDADRSVCRNVAGANLITGVASALIARPADATVGVLEVDEAALTAVAQSVSPRVIALGNLFRDQLDRHGELEMVADRWRLLAADLPEATVLVLGADDPVIDALGEGRSRVLRYGIDDPAVARAARAAAADSTHCVRCGAPYAYRAVYLGHLGDYDCPNGDHARGSLDFAAREVHIDGIAGTTFRLDAPDGSHAMRLPLPGLYNVENALAAITVAHVLGVPVARAVERLAGFSAAFGRFERLSVDGREAVLVLFKNPTGANEALRAIAGDLVGSRVVLALNDRIADGRDVSWIWDIDLEGVLDGAAGIVCTGTRAADLAVRLRYADVPAERIDIRTPPEAAFDAAVAKAEPGGRVYVLATYTAMLDLHRALAERGLTRSFWEGTR